MRGALLLLYSVICSAFRVPLTGHRQTQLLLRRLAHSDGLANGDVLVDVTSHPEEPVNALGNKHEDIFRKYPFEHLGLPTLPDFNNYYSGMMGDKFWHQNADQVFVFIPVCESLSKREVAVKFASREVSVSARGDVLARFSCNDRIIPEGSFWVLEKDKEGKRYIHLDMEKRHRMLNWKGLFQAPVETDATNNEERSKLLRQLLAANKGMSKLTGMPPESISELINSPSFQSMLSEPVRKEPELSYQDEDGTVRVVDSSESGIEGDSHLVDFDSLRSNMQ